MDTLQDVESLPIHDFKHQQRSALHLYCLQGAIRETILHYTDYFRYKARLPQPEHLVKVSLMASPLELTVEHDELSGSLLKYTEVRVTIQHLYSVKE